MLVSSPSTPIMQLRQARTLAHANRLAVGVLVVANRNRRSRSMAVVPRAASGGVVEPGDLVLVAGATGGVGQLVTAKLLERGYRVRAMTRNKASAARVFGGGEGNSSNLPSGLELVEADARDPASLDAAFSGSGSDAGAGAFPSAVACCTGTTAFPSSRWKGDNGPKQTDEIGVRNLVEATSRAQNKKKGGVERFVLVSSAGVDRSDRIPYSILNLFGVLTSKKAGEQALRSSGLPLTILRPGRLIDGPYTSYDLNTLLKATTDESRKGVRVAPGDVLDGQTSRLAVAEAVVQSLGLACTVGKELCLETTEGQGPGQDKGKWEALLCK